MCALNTAEVIHELNKNFSSHTDLELISCFKFSLFILPNSSQTRFFVFASYLSGIYNKAALKTNFREVYVISIEPDVLMNDLYFTVVIGLWLFMMQIR